MLVAELEKARDRNIEFFKGIGTPIVRIPIKTIGIYRDDYGYHATMTYDDLIALVKQAME